MRLKLALVGVALLGLTACGGVGTVDDEDYDSGPGVIQKKDIDGAHTTCHSRNKKGVCTYSSTDDKDWLLLVKPNNGKDEVWVDVNEETYNRYPKGGTYP
jgi:hypothetical protein